MNRRQILLGGLALAASTPLPARAASGPVALAATSRTIAVKGRAAKVLGLLQPDGTHGLRLDPGDMFDVAFRNDLDAETLIHWHGMLPPHAQDGVPGVTAPMVPPGGRVDYRFEPEPGTHWMHAHTLQEQQLLAAPLIVRAKADLAEDAQECVVLLHDFSFRSPEDLLGDLVGPNAKPMDHAAHMSGGMQMAAPKPGAMDHAAMGHAIPGAGAGDDAAMAGMDLNDLDYDAFLANDRTLDDPEVFRLERNGRARLRIINGAASTAFTIDTGELEATVLAVDGHPVQPVKGRLFPLAMGQRIDLMVEIRSPGAFPVLARVEGKRERTGFILATPGAAIAKLSGAGEKPGPVVGLSLEENLRALSPLPARKADRGFHVMLTGSMAPYAWAMQGAEEIRVKPGDRIEILLHNMSMMAHPMHTHGHAFQVIGLNGKTISGARRDVVVVPPMAQVRLALDAGKPGKWAFHCHHLYHMVNGMMQFIEVG